MQNKIERASTLKQNFTSLWRLNCTLELHTRKTKNNIGFFFFSGWFLFICIGELCSSLRSANRPVGISENSNCVFRQFTCYRPSKNNNQILLLVRFDGKRRVLFKIHSLKCETKDNGNKWKSEMSLKVNVIIRIEQKAFLLLFYHQRIT